MTNAPLLERPDGFASMFSLTSVMPPRLEENQMWVLLRIYTQDSATQNFSVTHQFAVQDGNRLLDAGGNVLQLAPGTYSKCYNWPNVYSVNQPINAFDPHLVWEAGDAPGPVLREQYVELKLSREMLPGDKLVVYRQRENGVIVDAGIAKQRGEKFFTADGMQIMADIQTLEIGKWLDQRILLGTLDPRDPSMNQMGWIERIQNAFLETVVPASFTSGGGSGGAVTKSHAGGGSGSSSTTSKAGRANTNRSTATPSNSMVTVTFYYVPHADEARFGGSTADLQQAGKMNGTYRDAQGRYWNWQNGEFVRVDGPLTSSGTTPRADGLVTLAVPREWKDNYILIVRGNEVVVTGIGEDKGGAFKPGSGKIDIYAGEGTDAWEMGFEKYYGKCRAYFFDTQAAMNQFINGL